MNIFHLLPGSLDLHRHLYVTKAKEPPSPLHLVLASEFEVFVFPFELSKENFILRMHLIRKRTRPVEEMGA